MKLFPGYVKRDEGSEGAALFAVVTVVVVLTALSMTLLQRSSSYKEEVGTSASDDGARLLALAGVNEAMTALRAGSSGAVGTLGAPARLGDGLLWVTSEELPSGAFRLKSTAMAGSGRHAMSAVVERSGGLGDLFRATINAKDSLTLSSGVMVDSFNSTLGTYESQATNTTNGIPHANTNGDVMSNVDITLNSNATVFGDATPGPDHTVSLANGAYVDGSMNPASNPFDYPVIEVPDYGSTGPHTVVGSETLGSGNYHFDDLTLNKNARLTIQGPANVVVDSTFYGGKLAGLVIDATDGPVTIYCDTYVHESGFAAVPVEGSPMAVAFMITGQSDIVFPSGTDIRGAYYAENSDIVFSADNEAWGAFVGNAIGMNSSMKFHFDEDLAEHWDGGDAGSVEVESLAWFDDTVEPQWLLQKRGDPFRLLGVQRSELAAPALAWIEKE